MAVGLQALLSLLSSGRACQLTPGRLVAVAPLCTPPPRRDTGRDHTFYPHLGLLHCRQILYHLSHQGSLPGLVGERKINKERERKMMRLDFWVK